MRNLVVIGLAVLLVSACGKKNETTPGTNYNNPNGQPSGPLTNGIYGYWSLYNTTQNQNGQSMTYAVKLRIDGTTISTIADCSTASGARTTSTTTVPADVSPSQIVIKQSGTKTETFASNGANLNCTAKVDPGTLNYTINGNSLNLSANGQQMTAQRVQ